MFKHTIFVTLKRLDLIWIFCFQLKNLIPKLKRQLRSAALASVSGAKAFLQSRSAVRASNKDDLVAMLKDKRNQDIL
jgi:hypothetical protein